MSNSPSPVRLGREGRQARGRGTIAQFPFRFAIVPLRLFSATTATKATKAKSYVNECLVTLDVADPEPPRRIVSSTLLPITAYENFFNRRTAELAAAEPNLVRRLLRLVELSLA